MPNYKEAPVSGTQWQRCNQVVIDNPYGGVPTVSMREEMIVTLNGDRFSRSAPGLTFAFDPSEVIPLLDPTTGQPTGQSVTAGSIYVALASMYAMKAAQRDAA